jgi:hypothetical protein|tara:strand:+ start:132 stop:386 length:255 start_codon:yes stop_codon:yes gene_type:complete
MLYSLFTLEINGERLVFEGRDFYSQEECMNFSTNNIINLNDALIYRLDRMYGENAYNILEIGCVQKDNHMNRKVIVNNNTGKET